MKIGLDQLRERLDESREKIWEGAGKLKSEVQAALEDEIAQYEAYVDKDGQRRQEVIRLREYAPDRDCVDTGCHQGRGGCDGVYR